VLLVHKVFKGLKVQQENKGLKVVLDLQVHKEDKVLKELKVLKVERAL
jgi:hypothetical protein